jgi:hypothetical protein
MNDKAAFTITAIVSEMRSAHERAFAVGCGPPQIGQICADFRRLCHVPAAAHSGGSVRFAQVEDRSHSVRRSIMPTGSGSPNTCG